MGKTATPKATPAAVYSGEPTVNNRFTRAVSKVGDAARAARNAMAFGLYDKAADALHRGNPNFQSEQALSEEAQKRSPIATGIGTVIGSAVPAAGISAGLGRAVAGLGKATLPSVAANQMFTGGLMSAGEDALHGEMPDWKRFVPAGLLSGAVGGALNVGSRLISPRARIAAAGAAFKPEDISAMKSAADRADKFGIKLTVPEMATAAVPGKSGTLESVYSAGKRSSEGGTAAFDFAVGRQPKVDEAVRGVASDISRGSVAPGLNASRAATEAIENARSGVRASAKPFYDAAEPITVPNVPKSTEIDAAIKHVSGNKRKMEELQGHPVHSVKFLDAVHKRLHAKADAIAPKDPWHASLIREDANKLGDAMGNASKSHAAGRQQFSHGMTNVVEPLEAGPLGVISENARNPTVQSTALIDVGTPHLEQQSIEAASRLQALVRSGSMRSWPTLKRPAPRSFWPARRAIRLSPAKR
jgi:hypothetical protein